MVIRMKLNAAVIVQLMLYFTVKISCCQFPVLKVNPSSDHSALLPLHVYKGMNKMVTTESINQSRLTCLNPIICCFVVFSDHANTFAEKVNLETKTFATSYKRQNS